MLFHLEDVVELCQEPFIDITHLPDLVNTISPMESRRNREYTLVRWVNEFLIDILNKVVLQTAIISNEKEARSIGHTFANPEN